jgi:hypothetical protein
MTSWGSVLAALLVLLAAPRTLVLVLDAVPYTAVEGTKLFADIGTPVPVVGTFPSTTTPAFSAMLAPLGVPAPPGYERRFFDRTKDEVRLQRPVAEGEDPFRWNGYFDWMERGLPRKTMHYARSRASARNEMRDALAASRPRRRRCSRPTSIPRTAWATCTGPQETRAFLQDLEAALRELRTRAPFRTVSSPITAWREAAWSRSSTYARTWPAPWRSAGSACATPSTGRRTPSSSPSAS